MDKNVYRPVCPLTNDVNGLQIIQSINVHDICNIYKRYRGISVDNEFDTTEIKLIYNERVGFYFFWPFKAGSKKFYSDFTSSPLYAEEKNEYKIAAQYIKDEDSVLDVGCGWGHFKKYIPKSKYYGLEFSEKSIEYCLSCNILAGSETVGQLSQKDEKYDVVVSFQVLEHVHNPREFFEAMIQCAKKNGLIILSVPNYDSFMSVMENNYLNMPPHHISWWSKNTFLYLAKTYNLELVDYHIEKLENNAISLYIGIKKSINNLLKRDDRFIRMGYMDRFLNKILLSITNALSIETPELMPNGHSITFILKRK